MEAKQLGVEQFGTTTTWLRSNNTDWRLYRPSEGTTSWTGYRRTSSPCRCAAGMRTVETNERGRYGRSQAHARLCRTPHHGSLACSPTTYSRSLPRNLRGGSPCFVGLPKVRTPSSCLCRWIGLLPICKLYLQSLLPTLRTQIKSSPEQTFGFKPGPCTDDVMCLQRGVGIATTWKRRVYVASQGVALAFDSLANQSV